MSLAALLSVLAAKLKCSGLHVQIRVRGLGLRPKCGARNRPQARSFIGTCLDFGLQSEHRDNISYAQLNSVRYRFEQLIVDFVAGGQVSYLLDFRRHASLSNALQHFMSVD